MLLKIMGIHGLGDHRHNGWGDAWARALDTVEPLKPVGFEFVGLSYDDLFESVHISTTEALSAMASLLASGFLSIFRGRDLAAESTADARDLRERGFWSSAKNSIRWSAGYVVAWLKDEEFRRQTRRRLLNAILEEKPDVILAHSLGSLISYDALSSDEATPAHLAHTYVTLGSQIGNPFVRHNLTPGRIAPLGVRHWYHLFNREDAVFTARVPLEDARFTEVDTYFDIEGFQDHSAVKYIAHAATISTVWRALTGPTRALIAPGIRLVDGVAAAGRAPRKPARRAPHRRALLVGINEYADDKSNLAGCVNDTFLISALLQDRGWDADEIRVVLDHRATTAGILERLAWLVEHPTPGDELFFFYFGHGAQLPTWGPDAIDGRDETLVPHDFDWSPQRRITDDTIFDLYASLPYELNLTMIFDCCHSGGIHRDGMPRCRGINPPDDIRHRDLRWDGSMWVQRRIAPINDRFAAPSDDRRRQLFCGERGDVRRLGRGMSVRNVDYRRYAAMKKSAGKEGVFGPYLPLIVEACAEHELAFEYRHGSESYGAFTFALVQTMRQSPKLSIKAAVESVGKRLRQLRYQQTPVVLAPSAKADAPMLPVSTRKKRRAA